MHGRQAIPICRQVRLNLHGNPFGTSPLECSSLQYGSKLAPDARLAEMTNERSSSVSSASGCDESARVLREGLSRPAQVLWANMASYATSARRWE